MRNYTDRIEDPIIGSIWFYVIVSMGVATDFLVGGTNHRQCGHLPPKYPKNRKRHRTSFSNLVGACPPDFKSGGYEYPPSPGGDAPDRITLSSHVGNDLFYVIKDDPDTIPITGPRSSRSSLTCSSGSGGRRQSAWSWWRENDLLGAGAGAVKKLGCSSSERDFKIKRNYQTWNDFVGSRRWSRSRWEFHSEPEPEPG